MSTCWIFSVSANGGRAGDGTAHGEQDQGCDSGLATDLPFWESIQGKLGGKDYFIDLLFYHRRLKACGGGA